MKKIYLLGVSCLIVLAFLGIYFRDDLAVLQGRFSGVPSPTETKPLETIQKLNSVKLSMSTVDFTASDGSVRSAVRITGPAGDTFGTKIANAGDVNGDGYEDMLVAAPYNDLFASDAGLVYLIFGPFDGSTVKSVQFSINESEYNLGTRVSAAGDLNGDGYDDIFISGGEDLYLIYGQKNPVSLLVSDLKVANFKQALGAGNTGAEASPLGDIDGDGYEDALIFSKGRDGFYLLRGDATAMKGKIKEDNKQLTLYEWGDSVRPGALVAENDINGDGEFDLVIGSTKENSIFTYLGYSEDFASGAWAGVDEVEFINADVLGPTVDASGDFNGDGLNDIVTGDSKRSNSVGMVLLVPGTETGSFDSDSYNLSGAQDLGLLGGSVRFVGDMNGDGYPEIAAGATGELDDAGNVYFIYGGADFDFSGDLEDRYDLRISGENADDYFGDIIEYFPGNNSFAISAKGYADGAVYVFIQE
ncbi:MAG: hypothetical protein AAB383_03960 [Patescibacteria group bacterium]